MTNTHPSTHEDIDHVQKAVAILNKLGAPAGTAESLATAQTHALLALVESNRQLALMNQAQMLEMQTSNLFIMLAHLDPNDPRRPGIFDALTHATLGCDHAESEEAELYAGSTIFLSAHLLSQEITVGPGDDLILEKDEKRCQVVVESADADQWLLLSPNGMKQVSSAELSIMFRCDLADVAVTLVPTP